MEKQIKIIDKKILFQYRRDLKANSVYVSGNFNKWTTNDSNWLMILNEDENVWELLVDISKVTKNQEKGFSVMVFSGS